MGTNRGYQGDDQGFSRYLEEIGRIPLLSVSEEVELAQRSRAGDREAKEALIQANLRFVVSEAMKYRGRGLSLPELVAEGNVGLIEAVERFDDRRGFKLISYAVWWIRKCIYQAISEQGRAVQMPKWRLSQVAKTLRSSELMSQRLGREPSMEEIAEELGKTIDYVRNSINFTNKDNSLFSPVAQGEVGANKVMDMIENKEAESPAESIENGALRQSIDNALKELSPREAEVIYLNWGIGRRGPLSLDKIGDRFGVSRARIAQIRDIALKKLQNAEEINILREQV